MMSKRQRKVVLRNLEMLFLEERRKLLIAPRTQPSYGITLHMGFEAEPYRWFGKPARMRHPSAPL